MTSHRKHVSSISRTIKHQEIFISTQQKLNIQIFRRLIFNVLKDVFSFVLRSQIHSFREINWSIRVRSVAILMNLLVISTIIELIKTNSSFYEAMLCVEMCINRTSRMNVYCQCWNHFSSSILSMIFSYRRNVRHDQKEKKCDSVMSCRRIELVWQEM